MLRRILTLIFVAITCAGAFGEVRVNVRLERAQIYLGEQATLQVDVNGVREVEPPELEIQDVEVTYLGGSGRSSSSVRIINGKMTRDEKLGYAMQYDLRPTRAGNINIPPVRIEHEGKTYAGRPLILSVLRPEDQEYVILEQEAQPGQPYVEQTVKVRLKIYLKKLKGRFANTEPIFPRTLPHLEVPWFGEFEDWRTSDVNDFAKPLVGGQRTPGFAINNYVQQEFFNRRWITFKLPRTTVTRKCKDGTTQPYFCYTLEKEFRPASHGKYVIPAVTFKGAIPLELDQAGRATKQKQILAFSGGTTIVVRPVPTEGRPPSFSGAVGRYTFEVYAAPKVAKVGDPIDLTLSITGDGILENVLPPDLTKEARLDEQFKVHAEAPATEITENTKTFRYTIRAKHENVEAIPPLSFSYFDVAAGEFKTARSKPVPLSISPTATMSLNDVVETSGGAARSRLGRERDEGILADFGGENVLANQQFNWQLSHGLMAILLLPPIAFAASLIAQRRVTRLRTDPALARSRAARKTTLAGLARLRGRAGEASHAEFCSDLSKALTCYVADKLNLPREGLTMEDVGRRLAEKDVDAALAESVDNLVLRCDTGQFAGSGVDHDRADMLRTAREVVSKLEKCL